MKCIRFIAQHVDVTFLYYILLEHKLVAELVDQLISIHSGLYMHKYSWSVKAFELSLVNQMHGYLEISSNLTLFFVILTHLLGINKHMHPLLRRHIGQIKSRLVNFLHGLIFIITFSPSLILRSIKFMIHVQTESTSNNFYFSYGSELSNVKPNIYLSLLPLFLSF